MSYYDEAMTVGELTRAQNAVLTGKTFVVMKFFVPKAKEKMENMYVSRSSKR